MNEHHTRETQDTTAPPAVLPKHIDKTERATPKQRKRLHGGWRWVGFVGSGLGLLILIMGFYTYTASPASIRKPSLEHYHFRMQIVVNGKAENLGGDSYQT